MCLSLCVCTTADNDFLEEGEGELKERIVVSKCYSAIGSSSSQHQIKKFVTFVNITRVRSSPSLVLQTIEWTPTGSQVALPAATGSGQTLKL